MAKRFFGISLIVINSIFYSSCVHSEKSQCIYKDFSLKKKKGINSITPLDTMGADKKYIVIQYSDSILTQIKVHDPDNKHIDHIDFFKNANCDVYKVVFDKKLHDIGSYYYFSYSNSEIRRYFFMSPLPDEDSSFTASVSVYKQQKMLSYITTMTARDTTNFVYRIKDLENSILKRSLDSNLTATLLPAEFETVFKSGVLK